MKGVAWMANPGFADGEPVYGGSGGRSPETSEVAAPPLFGGRLAHLLRWTEQESDLERYRRMGIDLDRGQTPPRPDHWGFDLFPSERFRDPGAPEGIRPSPGPVSALMDPGIFDWYFGMANDFPFSDDADTFDFFGGLWTGQNSRLNVQLRAFTDIPQKARTDMASAAFSQDVSPYLSVTAGIVTIGNLGLQQAQNTLHGTFHAGSKFFFPYSPNSTDLLVGVDLDVSPAKWLLAGVSIRSAPRQFNELRATIGIGGWLADDLYGSLQAGYEHEALSEKTLSMIMALGPLLGGRIILGKWGFGVDVYRVAGGPDMDGLGKTVPNTQIRLSIFVGGRTSEAVN